MDTKEFWQGIGIFICIIVGFLILRQTAIRIAVYGDELQVQKMDTCQSAGLTYGECYNVIYGGTTFSK